MVVIQLNHLIFNEISIYLAYKCNFKEILEFSLISKSAFKLFQNILSTNCKSTNIELPITHLYNYIKKCNNVNTPYKLIQTKDITFIQSKLPSIEFKNISNDEIYKLFKRKCKKLESILWIDEFKLPRNEIKQDHSKNGYFKFSELSISWDQFFVPTSSETEDDDLSESHSYDYSRFPYTFKFLNYYTSGNNLKKLNILNGSNGDDSLIIYKMDNLINYCSTLESIKFKSHACPPSFLNKLLSPYRPGNQLLSSLFIGVEDYNDSDTGSTSESRRELIENINGAKFKRDQFLIDTFSNSKNNLKRLLIKDICVRDLTKFIQSIVDGNKNKSLNSIGLLFNRKVNSASITIDVLAPLSQLPSLTSITCELSRLDQFTLFIKRYSKQCKINTLKIIVKADNELIIKHVFYIFQSFLKDNPTQMYNLQTIKLIDPLYLVDESIKSNLKNWFKLENRVTFITQNNKNSFEDYYY